MKNDFLALSKKYDMLPRGSRALAAVSGGADSVALLVCLHELKGELGIELFAAHYNHKLRGAESERDEEFVKKLCERLGVPLFTGCGDVSAEAAKSGRGVEETARDMRYAFLRKTAAELGGAVILTAHNAGDNAETVLMNLARGSGLTGLCGIPPVGGGTARPLLCVTRERILSFLRERGEGFVEDSTNSDRSYTRNRIRLDVVPILSITNPSFCGTVFAASERLRADDKFLNDEAAKALDGLREIPGGFSVPAEGIAYLAQPLAVRALRLVAARLPGSPSFSAAQLEALVSICRSGSPSAKFKLPGGVEARRVYSEFRLGSFDGCGSFSERDISPGQSVFIGESGLEIVCKRAVFTEPPAPDVLWLADSPARLTVRPRRSGDRIRLPGAPGSRSLKRLFIDRRVPADERDLIPVLCCDGRAAAVFGFGTDLDFLPAAGREAIAFEFRRVV